MKKIVYTIGIGLFSLTLFAQNSTDAIRFSTSDLNGTARFRAMSGAFGALGGDLSAINVNPAGSAVFVNNQIGLSLTNYNSKNNANFFGSNKTESDNNFDLNQGGAVFVFDNKKKSDWKKFTLAVDFENIQNFDNSIFYSGINPNNSVAKYFLHYANGIPLNITDGSTYYYDQMFYNEQQAYLGYQSFAINPVDATNANNILYTANVTGGNFKQQKSVFSNGYNGKLAFNFATQYTDKWYFGLNLNSHFLEFSEQTKFYESNSNSPTSGLQNLTFNNLLETTGNGFSFQLGTIFKPTNEVRLGIAYESPTWYKITDNLTQTVSALHTESSMSSIANVNPNITMVYEPYRLQTASKLTGSFAYVFKKKGLISIDYAVKDYSGVTFKPKNDFIAENNFMNTEFISASEIRLGGEYKIKKLSLRGGYRWEQSPYKNGKTMGDLTGFSAGLGYNFGATKLDLSYAHSQREYQNSLFNVGLTDAAKINQKNNNVTLSLLFEL